MPIYEYRCKDCGHQFDKLQKISETLLTVCPVCEKPSLEKLVSAAGFQLKGSGWYVTDFRDKNKKPSENKSSEGLPAKPEAPSEKSTESADKKTAPSGGTGRETAIKSDP